MFIKGFNCCGVIGAADAHLEEQMALLLGFVAAVTGRESACLRGNIKAL